MPRASGGIKKDDVVWLLDWMEFGWIYLMEKSFAKSTNGGLPFTPQQLATAYTNLPIQ
jgi:hypothetical protein